MASHSRPPRPRAAVSRAACTLALASAASASLLGETAHADPRPTADEVKAKVQSLYQQAEQATEAYNGAKQQADAAQRTLNGLQDELARKAAALNATRDALGTVAAAQYRSGSLDPSLQLVLSSSPQAYLEQAGMLDQLGNRQSAALAQLTAQQRDMAQTRAEAAGRLDALKEAQSRLAARKQTVQRTLAEAQALLARLSPADRAAVSASDGPDSGPGGTANRSTVRPPLTTGAPSARAAQAVAFAYRALGLPYVWGATGPNAYDCSGLTQAAWKSAGVALPRTTYTQINAGTRVAESELRPGDLVFFYSGVSHVGLYIGGGKMIHAPHPGAPVRIAPISEMPFAGATRPG